MKLPPDPYGDVPTKNRVKLQSYVPETEKDRLMLVIPNRDLYTLLINHALKRTVKFITDNNLNYSTPGDAERLLEYITRDYVPTPATDNGLRELTPTRSSGDTISRNATRAAARVRTATPHR
jgi:hypothetical protein